MPMDAFDLILRSARVIDPLQDVDAVLDVGIRDGRIAAIARDLPASPECAEEDLSSLYVCPGLVDLHGHWYEGSAFGIDPDLCLNHGASTVVDAGTTGFINYAEFKRRISDARIRVLAFLNIAGNGIPSPLSGELEDLRLARVEDAADVIASDPEMIVGVKVRLGFQTSGCNGEEALRLAMHVAVGARLPIMVHISRGSPTEHVLKALRPGDIVTHCFQGRGDGILHNGSLSNATSEARARGVIFDVGHGCGSFCWETARKAFEQYFYPDTISTDLHRYSIEAGDDMPAMMSKFLHLGMPLSDIVAKVTCAPAAAIAREQYAGALRPGHPADVFAFAIEEGEFPLQDTHGRTRIVERRVVPKLLLHGGVAIRPGDQPYSLRPFHRSDIEVFRGLKESA
jgi:dihydroorotase